MGKEAALSALAALVAEIDAETVTSRAIERFLVGESDGHELLQALYGGALDEPIPDRLLAVLRQCEDEPA